MVERKSSAVVVKVVVAAVAVAVVVAAVPVSVAVAVYVAAAVEVGITPASPAERGDPALLRLWWGAFFGEAVFKEAVS